MTRESKLQRFLRTLKKEGQITSEVYSEIYSTGSQPARIYDLPKMHKARPPGSAPPFRPIVSSIGTYNYNLGPFRLGARARALIPGTEMGIVQIPWCPRSNRILVRLFIVRHFV